MSEQSDGAAGHSSIRSKDTGGTGTHSANAGGTGSSSAVPVVAAGILSSRLLGLARERVLAHFAGASVASDLFVAALRGPNFLQNLIGEQAVSAAFIPIYSRWLEQGREDDARRLAKAVGGLLLVVVGGLGLLAFLGAPVVVALLLPGWTDQPELFARAITAFRIVLPGTVAVALSSWCLTILNSHRRFFLPYFAPTLWNAAIIVALVIGGTTVTGNGGDPSLIALWGCGGVMIGGVLQLLVQLPAAARQAGGLGLRLDLSAPGLREAVSAFTPVAAARGVVQISAYLDLVLLSWLTAAGAIASGSYAQRLYLLALALLGTAFAVVELPELSRLDRAETGGTSGHAREPTQTQRLDGAFRAMAFLAVPTVLGFTSFGYLIVGALLFTGRFGVEDTWLVYLLLVAYTVGLLPSIYGRVAQNAFYSLRDTRTPAKIAVVRMVVSVGLSIPLVLVLRRYAVADVVGLTEAEGLRLGALGVAIASGISAWVEWWALRRGLAKRLPGFALPWARVLVFLGPAVLAALPAVGIWSWLRGGHPLWLGPVILMTFAASYLVLAQALALPESLSFWSQARARVGFLRGQSRGGRRR